LALRGIPAQAIEGRALIPPLGAADAVILVDLDDLAAHAGGNVAKLALLIGGRLIDSRDAEIKRSLAHDVIPRW